MALINFLALMSQGIVVRKKLPLCFPSLGVKMAVEAWMTSPDLDGIIGDTCSVVCQPVALLAAAWNIPMVSNLCTSGHLSNRTTYPTFTRSVGSQAQNSFILDAMMDTFGYVCIIIIIIAPPPPPLPPSSLSSSSSSSSAAAAAAVAAAAASLPLPPPLSSLSIYYW